MKYAIILEIDSGEWDYLRRNPNKSYWTYGDPVYTFDDKESAQKEANRWNTASVVEFKE